jgi:hypothetical protein
MVCVGYLDDNVSTKNCVSALFSIRKLSKERDTCTTSSSSFQRQHLMVSPVEGRTDGAVTASLPDSLCLSSVQLYDHHEMTVIIYTQPRSWIEFA